MIHLYGVLLVRIHARTFDTACQLALMMGRHPRLGCRSPLKDLDDLILRSLAMEALVYDSPAEPSPRGEPLQRVQDSDTAASPQQATVPRLLQALPEGVATLWRKALDYSILELYLLLRMGQQYYGYRPCTPSSRRPVGTLAPRPFSLPSFYDTPGALRGIISQQLRRALHLPFPREVSPRTTLPHFIPVVSARQNGVTSLVTLVFQLSFCPPTMVLELWRRSVLYLQRTAELGPLTPSFDRSMATEPWFEELQRWIFDTLAHYVPPSAGIDLFLGLQSVVNSGAFFSFYASLAS